MSTTPLLVLGRQEVLDLLDMRALIDAVEGAQIEISAATAINPNRLLSCPSVPIAGPIGRC